MTAAEWVAQLEQRGVAACTETRAYELGGHTRSVARAVLSWRRGAAPFFAWDVTTLTFRQWSLDAEQAAALAALKEQCAAWLKGEAGLPPSTAEGW